MGNIVKKLIPALIGLVLVVALVFIFVQSGEKEKLANQAKQISQSTEAKKEVNLPAKKTYSSFPGVLPENERVDKKAKIATPKGEIVFEIFGGEAPKATSNFIFLARDGFYDGLTFHRVEPGFVIQGGDPVGDGRGGPGYQFEDEPVKLDYDRGIVAMANAGPNTNGSQFFIMLADNKTLPKNYTIFGKVVEGMEVVDKIQVLDLMEKVTIE